MKKALLIIAALLIVAAPFYFLDRRPRALESEPVQVLSRYLKASYARDFPQAYRFISTKDQRIKSEAVYLREQGTFSGFSLEVARKIAGFITIRPIQLTPEGENLRAKVLLRLPDANNLGTLLMDWDEDRLNALSAPQRQKILATIDRLHRNGRMKMLAGEEEFLLVKEGNAWKLSLNWGEGLRVNFSSIVPPGGFLEAQPVTPQAIVRSSEPFSVTFRVKNVSKTILTTRIVHKIEPAELSQYLDIVECALLLPVKLLPGKEADYSSTYLLRTDVPADLSQIKITYEFKLES